MQMTERLVYFMICPKCGMEFKDGIVICTDCGTTLVRDLQEAQVEMVPMISLPAAYATRLCAYLVYSDIKAEAVVNEENPDEKIILVSASQKTLASKHAGVFLTQEPLEEALSEVNEEDEPEDALSFLANYAPSGHQYKTVRTKYDEAVSTAFTFGGCAIGLVLLILDYFITNFLPKGSIMTVILFAGIAIAMIFGSIKYFFISKDLKKAAEEEGYQQVSIRSWLENNPIQKIMMDAMMEQMGSQFEETLIEREYFLLGVLKEQFPDINQGLLEYEAERYLDELDEDAEDALETTDSEDSDDSADTEETISHDDATASADVSDTAE